MDAQGMPRRKGELSPREVAWRCDVTTETVYRWVAKAEGGEPSPVKGAARRDASGRIWIRSAIVDDEPFYF